MEEGVGFIHLILGIYSAVKRDKQKSTGGASASPSARCTAHPTADC